MARVLLIAMPKKDVTHMQKVFSTVQVPCESVETYDKAYERIAAEPPTLVVAEQPAQLDALHGLKSVLKSHAPITPFLVTLKTAKASVAGEVMRTGAYDCLARPLTQFDVLASAKRATGKERVTLFNQQLVPPKPRSIWPVVSLLLLFIPLKAYRDAVNGPPANVLSLGSVHLSGIQWEDRTLWVGDWFDSSITQMTVKTGLRRKSRDLISKTIYKMQEGQPILICNTPESLITVGTDLKIRSHHRAVGLPTLNSVDAPGTSPAGLAWNGDALWSLDTNTGLLYRHGLDLRVLETIRSIVARPVGLTAEGSSLWVLGEEPHQVARLDFVHGALIWQGPFDIDRMLTEGMVPSGMAVGFNRLWLVSGGEPRMMSRTLSNLKSVWKVKHG